MLYGISSIFRDSIEGVKQKMKRTIMIMCTLAITALMVSAVSAVPNVTMKDNNDLIDKIANIDMSRFNGIEQRFIDEFGIEKYNETVFKIKYNMYQFWGVGYWANFEKNTIELNGAGIIENGLYYQSVNGLTQLIVYLMLLILLIFGHNEVGYALAVGFSALVLIVPCFLVGLIGGLPYASGMVLLIMELAGISPMQILYDYGVLGLLVCMCLIFPLAILMIIVAYPIAVCLMTLELLYMYITTALEIVEDW